MEPGPPINQISAPLVKLKADYDHLPTERSQRLQKLHEQLRNRQLEEFLDKFLIADAKIPGIGDAKVAALASNGIDTASDITQAAVERVQGFGPVLSAKLVAWRKICERHFRFDAARGVSAPDMAVVDRDITLRSAKLQQELMAGLARLRAIGSSATQQRTAMTSHLTELQPRYAQALTDASVGFEDGSVSIRLACVSAVAGCIAIFTAQPSATLGTLFPVNAGSSPVQQPGGISLQPQPITPSLSAPATPAPTPTLNTTVRQASDPAAVQLPPVRLTLPQSPVGDVKIRQSANLRVTADSSSAVVQVIAAGTVLHVYRRERGWLQVGDTGPQGWLFSGLADEVR
jgi:hypothetical protein